MAIYDLGTASLAANGEVTGVGTTWKAPLTLIRVGATIIFKTSPLKIYTISEIISDTQINVYNPDSETVPAGTGYAILAHDGITVQGLAQDVAETLRYYQSKETSIESLLQFIGQDTFDWPRFEQLANQSTTGAAEALASQVAAAESAATAVSARDATTSARDQTITAISNAGDAGTLVTLAGWGIGNGSNILSELDFQTFNFVVGGNYRVAFSACTNVPEALKLPGNSTLVISVEGGSTGTASRDMQISTYTAANDNFRRYRITYSTSGGVRNYYARESIYLPGGNEVGGANAQRVRGLLDVYSKSEAAMVIGSFQDGVTIESNTQQVIDLSNGSASAYVWGGVLPKTVPANSTPETTGGISSSAWISLSNASQLSKPSGSSLIGSGERNLQERNSDIPHSGDYTDLEAVLSSVADGGSVVVSPGTISGQYNVGNRNISGSGYNTVFNVGSFETALTYNLSVPHWQQRILSNLKFDGAQIQANNGVVISSDPYAGRLVMTNSYFQDLDVGVRKLAGNIGNTFRNVSMSNVNFAERAKANDEMHIGSEFWYNSHFDTVAQYAFELDATSPSSVTNPISGGIGQWWLKDSIIEASQGGGIRLKNKPGDCPTTPCGISNVWFEAIATGGAINVGDGAELPRVIKLIDTSIFFAEYSYINNIELTNSNLVTYGCRFDNADGHQSFSIDDSSSITAHEAYLNGSSGKYVKVESIASQTAKITGTSDLAMRGSVTKGRVYNPDTGKKLVARPFGDGGNNFGGTGSATESSDTRGIHSVSSGYYEMSGAAIYELIGGSFQITSGRWYVWGISANRIQGGADGVISIFGTASLGTVFTELGKWVHTFGVAQASVTGTANLRVDLSGVTGMVLSLADYYVVEFTNQRDALIFANSRMALQ